VIPLDHIVDTESRVSQRTAVPGLIRSAAGAALLIALGYYAGAKLGFALTLAPVPVSTLWPPNAILLAGLLLTPAGRWPLVLAAVFVAHLAVQFQSGVPLAMVLCWYVSNCSEALVGAVLLRRFGGGVPTFETFRNTTLFLGCAGLAAFLSSFLDAAFVAANGWGDSDYWTVWRTRFFSNVLATLTLVPVIVTTTRHVARRHRIPRGKVGEAAFGLAALLTVSWLAFVQQRSEQGISPALLYSPVPLLVGAAVRFGPWGASASLLVCALVAIAGAVLGLGPFVARSALDNALEIQLFLIVAWIPLMALAAIVRERARALELVQSSEEQLALAIEGAQLGRWEWDIASGRLAWCDITRQMYEVPRDEPVAPDTFYALVHPDDRALMSATVADALDGRGVDVEFRIRFPDGRVKWILSKGRTLYDANGRPSRMVGVKVDITARKAADLQIQKQRHDLAHESRVSVAGELSMALAHEMNQPLAAILANAGAAQRYLQRTPPDLRELHDIVEAIAQDNRRAAAIITRFGRLLRKEDLRWTPLDVNEVARNVIRLAHSDIISRGVSLTARFAEELPSVSGDAVQLQQVLLNLLVNACDALESAAPGSRRLAVTTGVSGEGEVQVTIRDAGTGIPEDQFERIFDPFVTTKTKRLGLGLAICRSIVTAHGGTIRAENHLEGGAVFSVRLPSTSSTQARQLADAMAASSPRDE
jgi:signal transduction histidine kinase